MNLRTKIRLICGCTGVLLTSALLDRVFAWAWPVIPGFLGIYPDGVRYPGILYIPMIAVAYNSTNMLSFAMLFPPQIRWPRILVMILILSALTVLCLQMMNLELEATTCARSGAFQFLESVMRGYQRAVRGLGIDWLLLLPVHLFYSVIAIWYCFKPWHIF